MYAIKNNKHKILAYLLSERIVSATNPVPLGTTTAEPIVLAIYSHNATAIRLLVENGAPITDSDLLTAFHTWVGINHMVLLDPADHENQDILSKQSDIFMYLIQQPGVNLNITDTTGKSLLYSAIDNNMSDILITTMKRHGAHIAEETNMNTSLQPSVNIESAIANIQTYDEEEPFSDMIVTNRRFVDLDWIRRQIEYVEHLSAYDKAVLKAYTYHGDVIVNSFLRGSFRPSQFLESRRRMSVLAPFHKYVLMKRGILPDALTSRLEFFRDLEVNHRTYIKSFIADLQRIVLAAPRTAKPIKVYRGIKDPEYMYAELEKSRLFQTSDFQSTSVSADQAVVFANNGLGVVIEVLLDVGTPCLLMEAVTSFKEEVEILLPTGIKLSHRQTVNKMYPPYSSHNDYMVSVIEMESVDGQVSV